jgi:hypothetical protein
LFFFGEKWRRWSGFSMGRAVGGARQGQAHMLAPACFLYRQGGLVFGGLATGLVSQLLNKIFSRPCNTVIYVAF